MVVLQDPAADGSGVSAAIALFSGLLSFLSPCVLPLIPSYVGFLTGMSAEEIGKYVRNPKGVNPGSKMPSQKDNLSERELDEVARFLATLK